MIFSSLIIFSTLLGQATTAPTTQSIEEKIPDIRPYELKLMVTETQQYEIEMTEGRIPGMSDLFQQGYLLGSLKTLPPPSATTKPGQMQPPPQQQIPSPQSFGGYFEAIRNEQDQLIKSVAKKTDELKKHMEDQILKLAAEYSPAERAISASRSRSATFGLPAAATGERSWNSFESCANWVLDHSSASEMVREQAEQCMSRLPATLMPKTFSWKSFVTQNDFLVLLSDTLKNRGENLKWALPYFHSDFTGAEGEAASRLFTFVRFRLATASEEDALHDFFNQMQWEVELARHANDSLLAQRYVRFCEKIKKYFNSEKAFFEPQEKDRKPLCPDSI